MTTRKPKPPKVADGRIYPCANCATMRTKDEGGTVFTVCEACWDKIYGKPAPAPEPDPLMGIDAQKWAQEFMRIWSGRWSEVDEALMIGWFANAIMRGFDEGQSRLRRELQTANPAPEPKQVADRVDFEMRLGIKASEPKQGSEDRITADARAMHATDKRLIDALRAQLASAREEIAKTGQLLKLEKMLCEDERAARGRAEARVKELSDALAKESNDITHQGYCDYGPCNCGALKKRQAIRAILVRAKEGEKR